MNKEREDWTLQQFEWKEIYKKDLDSLFSFTYKEQERNYYHILAYERLYSFYDELEKESMSLNSKLVESEKKLKKAEEILIRENKRKKNWRKVAITEGVVLTGIGIGAYILFIK